MLGVLNENYSRENFSPITRANILAKLKPTRNPTAFVVLPNSLRAGFTLNMMLMGSGGEEETKSAT